MRRLVLMGVVLAVLLSATAHAMDTDNLKVSLNVSTKDMIGGGTDTTYQWALDGKWHRDQPAGVFSLQVDSD